MSFAITAVAVAAVGTVGSMVNAEKARKEQRAAQRAQNKRREAQSAREKIAAVREQRIAQSQIQQAAATQGASGSSMAQGGYSAVGALTGGNIQFMNQMDSLAQRVAQRMERAQQYSSNAATLSSLSNLALQGASMMSPATPSQSGATYQAGGSSSASPK